MLYNCYNKPKMWHYIISRESQKMSICCICPRKCGADRSLGEVGFCRASDELAVAKIMLHKFEEPCICRGDGAGAIFFSGCNMGCVFCQNRDISREQKGIIMSPSALEAEIFSLTERGASCIDLVTPTHYSLQLLPLLEKIKPKLSIPIVWNSGGYECAETLRLFDGLVDIYMPDFKYYSAELSELYSNAPNYAEIALSALREMVRQAGKPKYDEKDESVLLSGVIMRHLILPSHRQDSIDILRLVESEIGAENVILSLMGQYTPDFYIQHEKENGSDERYRSIRRRITSFEYSSVLREAERLGFQGYMQDISSADAKYTPNF